MRKKENRSDVITHRTGRHRNRLTYTRPSSSADQRRRCFRTRRSSIHLPRCMCSVHCKQRRMRRDRLASSRTLHRRSREDVRGTGTHCSLGRRNRNVWSRLTEESIHPSTGNIPSDSRCKYRRSMRSAIRMPFRRIRSSRNRSRDQRKRRRRPFGRQDTRRFRRGKTTEPSTCFRRRRSPTSWSRG